MLDEGLSYDDVQIEPCFSKIESRKNCNLSSILVKDVKIHIPIVSSPMDTVTESKMIDALANYGAVGILHRFMSKEKQLEQIKSVDYFTKNTLCQPVVAIGATGDYFERVKLLYENNVRIFLIDVAHGHSIHVKKAIDNIKSKYSDVKIIAGNIATSIAAVDLASWGADALRVGIGNGCFTPEMNVKLENGIYRPIKEIEIGDKVYTHTGEAKEVVDTFEFDRDEEIMEINGIECTKNHNFYVVHKKYENIVNNNNIQEYAEWVEAEDLTEDYFLVEI